MLRLFGLSTFSFEVFFYSPLVKKPVDLSNFTVQIRKENSIAMFFFAILGINLAAWMILGGVMLPFILAEVGY